MKMTRGGMLESVVARHRYNVECNQHQYTLGHVDQDGLPVYHVEIVNDEDVVTGKVYSPLLTHAIFENRVPIAWAYLVFVDRGVEKSIEARLGICDQWEDPVYGNNKGELFSRRYFAESGPGIYPMPIEEAEYKAL